MSNGTSTRMQKNRQNILNAAETVFLKKGFPGTSMDEIAEVAGMSKQTVYAHFTSKETLFREVVIAMTGKAAATLKEDTRETPIEKSASDYLLQAAHEQLAIVMTPRLMRLRRMVIGEIERFPELGEALYENGPQKSIKKLASAMAHYTSIGELHTPDPMAAAASFNWLLMGAPVNAAMLLGDAALPDEEKRRKHVKESVRVFLSAYGAGKNTSHQPE